jgi:(1->4)-alpha-D-glucan 1-alpha-D-glucosylmutase
VLDQYLDIWGRAHGTSEATERALLGAMGLPAGTDPEVAAALLQLDRQEAERPLRPVQVVREPARPHRVEVTLPAGDDGKAFRWRLRRESGAEDLGEFTPAALEEVGRSRLDGQERVRRVLAIDLAVEAGYHRFAIEPLDGRGRAGEMSFIVAPETCYLPPALRGEGRVWGFAAQLYSIRSERNWGIGDFGDLRRVLEFCARNGAGAVLLNPLHALFPDAPDHACPYSPSSRAFFNLLYLDVQAVPEFAECPEAKAAVDAPAFQTRLRALRAAPQVDYRGVAEAKREVLELLYRHFRTRHLAQGTDRGHAFLDYRSGRGPGLRWQALFDALQEHFRRQDEQVWGWPAWPEPYRDPHSPEVAAFAEAHAERVECFEYLQWQAADQLAAAGRDSWEQGLGIGLILDLAIGVAPGGSATWTGNGLYARDAAVGAPPDEVNRMGQNWGLPPWIPHRLTEAAYEPFIELLRANMASAGALRVDHVMGLCRLFWVPQGLPIAEGSYVAYPFGDLLGILALESQRNRCLVIGEDLGTVPDEVRRALQATGVLSTRLLYFERREDGRLMPPEAYPVQAVAAVTTHDLPTLAGFWQGLDIGLRTDLHLYPDEAVRDQQILGRAEDRAQLLLALGSEGLVPAGGGLHQVDLPAMTPEFAAAVYTYLARAPSKVLLVQLEDGFGGLEQPNLPGTVAPAYPSWRLKLPLDLEEWPAGDHLQSILSALRRERPALPAPGPGGAGPGLRSWIPRATYRLQVNRDFDLRQATALVDYLDELGVSHCYLSPMLKARPGSRHGYDITDHGALNPEIAGPEDFQRFAAALADHGMGLVLDMVPNHMGIMSADNRWWLDVLENGPASRFAGYFDIDWHPIAEDLAGRVLLPVLGDHYGAVLESGDLKVELDPEQGSFCVTYFEHRLPVDPREYPRLLGAGLPRLQARLGAEDPVFLEFQSLVTAFAHLPARDNLAPEAVAERNRDKEVHKHHLAALLRASGDLAQHLDGILAEFNGALPGAGSADRLHDLLEAQAYRLAYWRVAADEINYRRFFDINTLAALRMDNPEVFEATHQLVRDLLARGWVNGLRIDHPDGLFAPREYFQRLQAMAKALAGRPASADPRPLYLVAEKILGPHEHLPEAWPIHGTTGYDFSAACGGLFIDPAAEDRFTGIYHAFLGQQRNLEELARENKRLIMDTLLAGELQVLATELTRLAKGDRRTSDFTLNSLRGALLEILANFPVYRTYVAAGEASKEDVNHVDWAVGVAKKRSVTIDPGIFDFARDALLGSLGQGKSEAYRDAVAAFAMKFQQYSGPVMAKAMEDTTFYQYNRLVALNEVGGDPGRFGLPVAAFHHGNLERARRWPHAMLAGSTHDSKRSEDVRARISVLSEMPEAWGEAVFRWRRLARGPFADPGALPAPSPEDEYLLYQTLVGIWPFGAPDPGRLAGLVQRVEDYMVKAVREAKVHSSWLHPDPEYEAATRAFVRALLEPGAGHGFLDAFRPFQARVARLGAFNSMAQLVLRLTAPGVPDFYQGGELWDLSLVDPDNRRPVDFGARRAALAAVRAAHDRLGASRCAGELIGRLEDGQIKLYLIWKTLAFRRGHEALFRDGDYLPLKIRGQRAEHLCAFARRFRREVLVVAVPRRFHGLPDGDGRLPTGAAAWGDTWLELPPGRGRDPFGNLLTDEAVSVQDRDGTRGLELAELFRTLPFALLHGGGTGAGGGP